MTPLTSTVVAYDAVNHRHCQHSLGKILGNTTGLRRLYSLITTTWLKLMHMDSNRFQGKTYQTRILVRNMAIRLYRPKLWMRVKYATVKAAMPLYDIFSTMNI